MLLLLLLWYYCCRVLYLVVCSSSSSGRDVVPVEEMISTTNLDLEESYLLVSVEGGIPTVGRTSAGYCVRRKQACVCSLLLLLLYSMIDDLSRPRRAPPILSHIFPPRYTQTVAFRSKPYPGRALCVSCVSHTTRDDLQKNCLLEPEKKLRGPVTDSCELHVVSGTRCRNTA